MTRSCANGYSYGFSRNLADSTCRAAKVKLVVKEDCGCDGPPLGVGGDDVGDALTCWACDAATEWVFNCPGIYPAATIKQPHHRDLLHVHISLPMVPALL
jgi:hypothetical protein